METSRFVLATPGDGLDETIVPVIAEAEAMVISTPEDVERANERRRAIKELMGKVEDAFGGPKKKAHETWKMLVAKEKEHLAPLEKAYDLIGQKMGTFLQAEEERRQAEQKRLEEEAQKKQAAELAKIEKKTAALLEKAGGLDEQIAALQNALNDPDTPEGEAALMRVRLGTLLGQRDKAAVALETQASKAQEVVTAPVPAYMATAPKVAGLSSRVKKVGVVTDKLVLVKAVAGGRLPLDLLDVNAAKLNFLIKAGVNLPGVSVREERVVATR